MGYPMSWRRIVGRNHLDPGDSTGYWHMQAPTVAFELLQDAPADHLLSLMRDLVDIGKQNAEALNGRVDHLAHDLARFRADSVDEGAVVRMIAELTELDPDDIAAVLQAFLNTV